MSASDNDDFSLASDDSFDEYFLSEEPKQDPIWTKAQPIRHLLRENENGNWQSSRPSNEDIYGSTPVLNTSWQQDDGPRIRLLRLAPGLWDASINGFLIIRPVFDAPEGQRYIALSYSWGTDLPSKPVYIDDIRFMVTPHLSQALRMLRSTTSFVDIWLDTICINQQNLLDKASQVQIMAQIFNQASEVRIWLGSVHIPSSAQDMHAIRSLTDVSSPWWQRLWPVQECGYARTCPMVMSDTELLSLQDFVQQFANKLQHFDQACTRSLHNVLANILSMMKTPYEAWLLSSEKNIHRLPLIERLRQTVDRHYSEPHDRIYALLSLVDEDEICKVQPDYSLPLPRLREKITTILISTNGGTHKDYRHLLHYSGDVAVSNAGNAQDALQQTIALPPEPQSWWQVLEEMLIDASRHNAPEIVLACLRYRIDISDNAIITALASSIFGDHDIVLKALFTASMKGRERHSSDDERRDGNAMLAIAIYCGSFKCVQYLLNTVSGGHRGIHDSFYGTALEIASYMGHEKIVDLLIRKDVLINHDGINGTPLRAAMAGGHLSIVKLLLDKGAKVNRSFTRVNFDRLRYVAEKIGSAREMQHETIFDEVDDTSILDVAKLLSDCLCTLSGTKSAQAPMKRVQYSTALQCAIWRRDEEMTRLLLSRGADMHTIGNTGQADHGLTVAAKNRDVSMTQLLLEYCKEVNMASYVEAAALEVALDVRSGEIVLLLLQHARGLAKITYLYLKAISIASQEVWSDVVRVLLKEGKDEDSCQQCLIDELVNALERRCYEIACLLVNAGVAVDAPNRTTGLSAMDVARDQNDPEMIGFLQPYIDRSQRGSPGAAPGQATQMSSSMTDL